MVRAVRSLKPAAVLRRWAPALAVVLGGGSLSAAELKRAGEEARAAKRRSDESFALLDALQSAAPLGFALVDAGFRFLRVNPAFAAATGLDPEQHIGRPIEAVVPALWPQVKPALERVIESGAPIVNVEVTGEMPIGPGEERHWLATFYPVRVENRLTGIGFIAVEVSAQRRVEAQLRQAQKMEAIGILTGGVAHDFNNLLGVIIGNLDLLAETEHADAEVLELAGEARDAALRGADLTRRLLAFARRQPLQPQELDVNTLVSGETKLLERLLGESIEIALELEDGIWPILADAAQLEASLANLATNARDAMPAGGNLRIATRNCELDAAYAAQHPYVTPGDYVLIEVTDTGSGMTPEVMSRIFEPFFTTKEQGRGSGLGLSMVFGFMKQSGGHISVESELGHGTTCRLYFARAAQGARGEEKSVAEPLPMGRGETVLLVEDNAALRRMAVRQLGELGYRVREAENAPQAMEMLARDPAIDLLFTDVVMPGGMDGRQLADRVAARWPRVKVLLASGFPGSVVSGGGLARGAHLLSKPYRREQLARALREAIEREGRAGGDETGAGPASGGWHGGGDGDR